MTPTLLILPALGCALAYLGLTNRAASPFRSLIKTSAVALLAMIAALNGGPILLIAALALCALGDFALSRPGERAFLLGVAAFAAGHLAYVVLFLGLPEADPARLLEGTRPLLLLALAAVGLGMGRLLAPRAGALKGPVLAYIPIILAMTVSALTLPWAGPLGWVAPAALVFLVSDIILATEVFLLPPGHRARPIAAYAIWTFYWGAQAGFLAACAGL